MGARKMKKARNAHMVHTTEHGMQIHIHINNSGGSKSHRHHTVKVVSHRRVKHAKKKVLKAMKSLAKAHGKKAKSKAKKALKKARKKVKKDKKKMKNAKVGPGVAGTKRKLKHALK